MKAPSTKGTILDLFLQIRKCVAAIPVEERTKTEAKIKAIVDTTIDAWCPQIVIVGNPINGLRFDGPYRSEKEALRYRAREVEKAAKINYEEYDIHPYTVWVQELNGVKLFTSQLD